jgi:activator of HSP90 ATPase
MNAANQRRIMMNDLCNQTLRLPGLSRRKAMAGFATAFAGLMAGKMAASESIEEISHTAQTIHQETSLKADRKRVYQALTETAQFDKISVLSGAMNPAAAGYKSTRISTVLGGEFVLFGGHIIGRQLELMPGERLVQAWRVVDWEAGVYSVAKFVLHEEGSGTRLVFDHTGFPNGLGAHLAEGWRLHYWEPMAKYFA